MEVERADFRALTDACVLLLRHQQDRPEGRGRPVGAAICGRIAALALAETPAETLSVLDAITALVEPIRPTTDELASDRPREQNHIRAVTTAHQTIAVIRAAAAARVRGA